jgi:cation channel sperm-associated protein 3
MPTLPEDGDGLMPGLTSLDIPEPTQQRRISVTYDLKEEDLDGENHFFQTGDGFTFEGEQGHLRRVDSHATSFAAFLNYGVNAPPKRKFRSHLHRYVVWYVNSLYFNTLVMMVILANALAIAIETERDIAREYMSVFEAFDVCFLTVYTLEFVLKIWAEPLGYWKSNYNKFDFSILVISFLQLLAPVFVLFSIFGQFTFLRVLRAVRALRALRSVSFVRSLQVIVVALLRTLKAIVNILFLLLLVMYVFAIMGYYFFGVEDTPARARWGQLQSGMLALFVYVTADGWTDIQNGLADSGYTYSWIYSVIFIFIGHFIFTNLFIGVVIQNLDEATEEDKREQLRQRRNLILKKKAFFMDRQQRDLEKLLASQKKTETQDLHEILSDVAATLRHEELTPMSQLLTSPLWIRTYVSSLKHYQKSVQRSQHIHFELANVMGELAERRIQQRIT